MKLRKCIHSGITLFVSLVIAVVTVFAYPHNVNAVDEINSYYYNGQVGYKVYDADSKTFLREYYLDEMTDPDNLDSVTTSFTPRVIDWSKSGVVKIMTDDTTPPEVLSSGYYGTGFVIDDHVIATVAHCVMSNPNYSPYASLYHITSIKLFNSNGSVSMTATPVEIHIPKLYYSYGNEDYALITVEEDLSDYACFNLGTPLPSLASKNQSISITGFPLIYNDVVRNNATTHNMYTALGTITSVSSSPYYPIISYNAGFESQGDSGAPVYVTETYNNNTYYTVIGIHRQGTPTYSNGVEITANQHRFYTNNNNLNW